MLLPYHKKISYYSKIGFTTLLFCFYPRDKISPNSATNAKIQLINNSLSDSKSMQLHYEKSENFIAGNAHYVIVIIIIWINYYYYNITQEKLMRTLTFQPKDIIQYFYKYKILTKDKLMELAGFSHMTAWRILSDHGYLSSYNFNARYYTLIDIPEFDDNGLWSFRKVCFSRYGSLTKTTIELIKKSKAGLSAGELENLLKVTVKPSLLRLYREGKISREKVDTVFIYFSADSLQQEMQISKRRSQLKLAIKDSALPQPDLIIAVLVELIKKPQSRPDVIAKRLSSRQIHITIREVKAIFTYYGLEKKND